MIQRDYLVRQAEQLGQVLAVILGRMLGINIKMEQQQITQATVDKWLADEVDFSTAQLLAIPEAELIESLQFNYHFNDSSLESLAEILFLLAENETEPLRETLQKRSLILYEYLESRPAKTWSFSRKARIEMLRSYR